MINMLTQFLSKLNIFSKEEIEELCSLIIVQEVKKNVVLIEEGQICSTCYWVLKGCLRQYILADGREKTVAFYTEEQPVNFFTSKTSGAASGSYLSAVEDTWLLGGNREEEKLLYARFPKLQQFAQLITEKEFGKMQDGYAGFITRSPEERYLHLLKEKPDLLQRVPLHQIASYLGITPESLSRIRKRTASK